MTFDRKLGFLIILLKSARSPVNGKTFMLLMLIFVTNITKIIEEYKNVKKALFNKIMEPKKTL